jgi:hypothetical protein
MMMKKLLVLMLVLGITSMAHATYVLTYDGQIDIETDGAGGPWESYWILVTPTTDATITGGSLPAVPPLDASSVFADSDPASNYNVPPGEDGKVGYIGSYSLTPPFTGVTNATILENFDFTLQPGKTQAVVTLYELNGTSMVYTYESDITIPEPMTIALLGLGSLFLLRRRK